MANVVLCSEMGHGLRYMAKLADCATELQSQKHNVKLVCADIAQAHQLDAFKKVSIFQAPLARSEEPPKNAASKVKIHNYSSIIMQHGFADADILTPILRGWLHLLATLDADLIMVDQAPTALLASKLLMIPCVMMGSGYTVPPRANPLPSNTPWRRSKSESGGTDPNLVNEDARLLGAINTAIKNLNFEKIELKEAQELYSHADQWIMSFAEIDHYGRREADYVVRWIDTTTSADPQWPDVQGEKIFVFMDADSAHTSVLLQQLKDRGQPVLAVIPGATKRFIEQHSAANVRVQQEPVNIRQTVEQCRVFINHCGHNLVYELLKMGVPSILLPNNAENTLLAYRVAKRKLGFPGPARADNLDINTLIEKVGSSDQIWANASRLSMKYDGNRKLARLSNLIANKLPAS